MSYPIRSNDNILDTVIKTIDEGIKWLGEMWTNFVVNNNQAFMRFAEWIFDTTSKFFNDSLKPVFLQMMRNYSIQLQQEQINKNQKSLSFPKPQGLVNY